MGSFTESRNPMGDMDTFQGRFWWFRNKRQDGMTLDDLATAVNRHLERDKPISISTLSNYEDRNSDRASEPRASFLAALATAFPDFNISWLVTGVGPPDLAEPSGQGTDTGRRVPAQPLQMLGGLVVHGPYVEAFKRLKQSCPDLGESSVAGLDSEGRQKEVDRLDGLLRELIVTPVARIRMPGQENELEHRYLVDYSLAMIHALMLAIPGRRKGMPLAELIEQMTSLHETETRTFR